jgi:uncharacterized membrane protein
MKKSSFVIMAIFAILIAFYPVVYAFMGDEFGILLSKSKALLASVAYRVAFYTHIGFGGLALLTGWPQFNAGWRRRNISLHRTLGKIYVGSALLSGSAGIIIAMFATGGLIAVTGFAALGCVWTYSTFEAYRTIRKGDVAAHQRMMIYSYAACFAAVTLRIWLPSLSIALQDFTTAYRITAWLCWVPNLLLARYWVSRLSHTHGAVSAT